MMIIKLEKEHLDIQIFEQRYRRQKQKGLVLIGEEEEYYIFRCNRK